MSITLGRYEFEGPFSIDDVENRAGIYVILNTEQAEVDLLELGEAREIKSTLKRRHPVQWQQNSASSAEIYIHYTPAVLDDRRRAIEREIRQEMELELAA